MPAPRKKFHYDRRLGRVVRVKDEPHRRATGTPAVMDAYSKRPVQSMGLSVMPHQAEQMRERVRECGANQGCEVDNRGRVSFTSANARKKVMKHLGYHDRDSYGGR